MPPTSRSRASVSPAARRPATTRFLLRLPAALHTTLTADAALEGLSLNAYCVQRLAGPDLRVTPRQHLGEVLAHAARVAGPHLLGVMVHGSWVRGEARDGSDVDVMVVVDRALPLSRGLYTAWDEATTTWEGRPVDAHFVHLPAPPARAGSIWCELAVEGLLLSDRSGAIVAALIEIRRAIAHGRLVRKTAHGQPYWTDAA